MRLLTSALSFLIAATPPSTRCASAKEYTITPEYSGGRKVVFNTPHGWKEGAVSPTGNAIIFRPPNISWLPDLSICVRHLYIENQLKPDAYVQKFISWLDAASKATGNKDSPKPQLTKLDSFDTPTNGKLSIWCIRSATDHDYLITEIINRDIQVEITLKALDADELVDKITAMKMLATSVLILDR